MFNNVGRKIMMLAKIIGIVGIVAAAVFILIFIIGLIDSDDELWIIGLIGAGSGLALLVSTWPLYAFGQITEDVRAILKKEPAVQAAAPVVEEDLPDL